MSTRVVRNDKTAGLYVYHQRRKFRPSAGTLVKRGDKVSLVGVPYGEPQDPDTVRIILYGPPYQEPFTSGGRTWQRTNRDILADERWVSTEQPPQIIERLKDGQMHLVVNANGRKTTVVVGSDGFNYRDWRRESGRYQKKTAGMNILVTDKLLMTWDEWDAFVAAVEDARTQVEIGPAVTKLQEDLAAEDMIQEYIQEKGLG